MLMLLMEDEIPFSDDSVKAMMIEKKDDVRYSGG